MVCLIEVHFLKTAWWISLKLDFKFLGQRPQVFCLHFFICHQIPTGSHKNSEIGQFVMFPGTLLLIDDFQNRIKKKFSSLLDSIWNFYIWDRGPKNFHLMLIC